MRDASRTATIQYHSGSGKYEVIVRDPFCDGKNTQIDREKVNSDSAALGVINRWHVDPKRVTVLAAD